MTMTPSQTAVPSRTLLRFSESDRFTNTTRMDLGSQHFELVSSTAEEEPVEEVAQKIEALFEMAKEEAFEDGVESGFETELASFIGRYGNEAIAVLTYLIISEHAKAEVASEALRVLGRINHPQTLAGRLLLLERSLYCSSPWIRDGAILGLASLDNPHAIRYLKQAIEREQIEELQEDMQKVLAQLETHQ
jgi:HEAT repeat protein